ncbi:hypothetical protein GWK47_017958 [Chionoecetes opilio]|uniref:Endonuclease/exonuclease/phosphatase domain-containing protein n=1 Tax=Chionoecetes opilio TaxID=41210 RepID=A0A8J5CIV2_CHIOP|nr:hypothetical protein GWK47_017958 [Chionoecetes opilio]
MLAAYVDLKRAFDSVHRASLWDLLRLRGILARTLGLKTISSAESFGVPGDGFEALHEEQAFVTWHYWLKTKVQPPGCPRTERECVTSKIERDEDAILLCVCYRPQWQGREPIEYLHTHLDDLLQQHTCEHVVIIGDMNQHLVARSFDDFLTVYGLTNQVDFPTHISGSSLDPVISDLPDSVVTCSPLGAVGSSDHMAILSTIQVAAQRDAPITRTNWLWGRADWDGLCDELQQTPWSTILVNDVDTQVHTFTRTLLELQKKYVPSQTYTAKPLDKPWFGYQSQVRSLMEYAPLTWSSCPPSYLSLLDKVQARAQRLIRLKALQDQLLPPLQPLQQRRDRSRSVRRLQDTQAACPAPGCSPTALGKTTRPHHTNCCYQGPSTDRPFCQDGDLSAFLPSALHKNVEPNGTADTASLYLVTPDLQECCERLVKAAIV